MFITLNIINDFLHRQGIATRISGNEDWVFKDVRNYYPECKFDKNYLYFCLPGQFPSEWNMGSVCFAMPSEGDETSPLPGCSLLTCICDEKTLFVRLQECFYTYYEWRYQLNECLLNNGSLRELLSISHSIFNNPILIDDVSFRTLAFSNQYEASRFGDTEWSYVVSHGYHTPEYVDSVMESPEFKNNISSNKKPFIHQYNFLAHPSIYGAIRIDGQIAGFLTIIGISSPLTSGMADLADFFSKCLSGALSSNNGILRSKQQRNSGMILDMLCGKITDPELLDFTAAKAGLSKGESYYIAKIVSSTDSASDRLLLMQTIETLENNLYHSKMLLSKDSIIIIANAKKIKRHDLLGISENLIRFNQFIIGFSLPFDDFLMIPLFYRQAEKAILFGHLYNSNDRFYFYENVIPFDLLSRLENRNELSAICHPAIKMLEEYDTKRGTELKKTLYLLLKNHGDIIKTSDDLFLHRNSMYYRIKKISELTGVDLESSTHFEHLLISLRVEDMLQSLNISNPE